ncbi:MAG: reverse transcriptase family protein [Sedimenticola sp.]
MTYNIEGVKGNTAALIDLSIDPKIICLQETWLWTFESQNIDNIVPNYESFVICNDLHENIANFQVPRGKAGIAMLWPREWSSSIKRLDVGNERIQAIELRLIQGNICIINTYMPTLNLPTSRCTYMEHLDILHDIISRFSQSHKIILCGDLNGTLLPSRANAHDILLRDFVQEHHLINKNSQGTKQTYYGHGGGHSQIDYILTTEESVLNNTMIADQHPTHLSTHVYVSSTLVARIKDLTVRPVKQTSSKPIQRYVWDKIDINQYQDALHVAITKCAFNGKTCVNDVLQVLTEVLNKTAERTVPHRKVKLKGPKYKLSPAARALKQESKKAHFFWKQANSPRPDHPLSIQCRLAKYNLRKHIRREFAGTRDDFYNEIMEHPTDKHFYKLIRRSQSSTHKPSPCLVINGVESTDLPEQRIAFANYFEDLAAPKQLDQFDDDHLELSELQLDLIEQVINLQEDEPIHILEEEVRLAIMSLNNGKAADESCLTAEHLKCAGKTVLPIITLFFNQILEEKKMPDGFRTGIVTPIQKKGKDPTHMGNYRGITISSIIGKVFEVVILNRLIQLNCNQSELQCGFTKCLSPAMASLLLSEAIIDSTSKKEPLYIATLDSQKAFDVVHHTILLKKLYYQGITGRLWSIIRLLYTNLTAKVKWAGEVSESLKIQQGVRQGGILSTHFYKAYINDLLLDLESRTLGKHIGTIYTGCPTCADDVLLMSSSSEELQLMLHLASSYSQEHRYIIHPQKSAVVRIATNSAHQKSELVSEWKIGHTDILVQTEARHLGLIRTQRHEGARNIEDRIKLARRTLYSLMKAGVHGTSGINPRVSYKIYRTYVLPRLLYSLETITLRKVDMKKLEIFHNSTLRNLQSLPLRTATSAVLLLLGALPIEAEIHKRHFSLVHNIANSKNTKFREIMKRQLILRNKLSFFTRTSEALIQYELPAIDTLENIPKLAWKRLTRSSVDSYWTTVLTQDANLRSTLASCNINILKVGETHPVWRTINHSTLDVKRGITKARLLTGTYMLQSTKARFNKYEVDETCPLCRLESEDLSHMLTRCPALSCVRNIYISDMRHTIIETFGQDVWSSLSSRPRLTSLIVDCTVLVQQKILPANKKAQEDIETLSRRLCYRLHVKRLEKLNNQ